MTDQSQKPPVDVNAFLREQRNANRVNWVPSISRDPAEQRRDRDALNDAIRQAGGHAPQHEPDGQEGGDHGR